MSVVLWSNNAAATLAAPITSAQTTITLTSGQGSLFPTPASAQFFPVTLQSATNSQTIEIVYCIGRSGDTLTVQRAQEGTTGQAFNAGDLAQNRVTAGTLGLFQQWPQRGHQVFTSSGLFTVPEFVTQITVIVAGGGGGSGGTTTTNSSTISAAPGGNSGAVGIGIISVTPGTVIPVTVGAGGGGGSAGGGSGGNGGTSFFGSFVTAPGGDGAPGGPAAAPPITQAANQSTQSATGGIINLASVQGDPSVGGNLANAIGGKGGDTPIFGGGGSAGFTATPDAPGMNGQSPGAGGGGDGIGASTNGTSGHSGASGIVIVLW